jgi:hypothetical protein
MSFAAGFASTFVPALQNEIQGRKERAEKNADLAWEMFTENMTKRQKARAEAERRRRQAETIVTSNGGSRDMIPDVYRLLRDEVYDPADLGEMIQNGRFQPVSTDTTGTEGMPSPDSFSESRKEMAGKVYTSFLDAGFSDAQARALTAEINRENSLRPDLIFGGHTDPHNNADNMGMLSWQGDRAKAFRTFMRERGHMTSDGRIKASDEALRDQAKFIRWEMENNPAYSRTKEEFLQNPNVDPETAAKVLGDNYIRWRRTDPEYSSSGQQRIAEGYALLGDVAPVSTQDSGVMDDTTATPNAEDNQMDGIFNFRGDSGNAFSVDDQSREIFEERVRAAGLDPEEVDFSATYDDPMAGREQRYRIAPESAEFNPQDYAGMDPSELQVLINTTDDPQLKADLQRVLEAQQEVQGPDLPSLGDVREGNYQALAAQARDAGDEGLAEQIEQLGVQMSGSNMELGEDEISITFTDTNGEERTTLARQDMRTGRFVNLATSRPIPRDAVTRAVPVDQIGAFGKEYSRVATRVEPLQEARTALLDTMSSAERLDELARRSPGILTTVGNTGARLVTRLQNEFKALNDLVKNGATDEEIEAQIQSFASDNAGLLEEIGLTSRDASLFNAEVLRFAFNYARTGLGQEGVGLSNQDFQNALNIVSSGSSYETFSQNLRERVNEGIANVERTRLNLAEDPQILNISDMPQGREKLTPIIFTDTATYAESRGMSDVLQWAQGEQTTEAAEQPTETSPDETAGRQTEEQPAGPEQQDQRTKAVSYTGTVTEQMAKTAPSFKPYVGKEVILYEDGTFEVQQ